MTDARPPDDSFHAPGPPNDEGPYCEEIQHSQVSALVPERVARGVFSTGAVVVQGAHEFILDFLLRMSQPQQVAARVVLPPGVVAQFIAALTDNLNNYQSKFGQPVVPTGPTAPATSGGPGAPAPGAPGQPPAAPQSPVSAQDLYEQLKLQDDVLSGNYANAVMIGHTPCEFCFDFITTFFPRSAVSCRVFMAAPGVPRLLDSLKHSFEKFQQKAQQQRRNPPPAPAPPEEP
jgi:Protein of unknown function (DUF3467)